MCLYQLLIIIIILNLSFSIVRFINFRSPEELYTEYDPAGVAFKPAIPIPKKNIVKKNIVKKNNINLSPEKFEKFVNFDENNTFADVGHVDFYKACKNKL